MQTFDAFTADNDPHGEHDFGTVEHGGTRIVWKIDDYPPPDREHGSEDPADPAQVLTLMLAEEYRPRSRATPCRMTGFARLCRGGQEFPPGAARGLQRRQPGWRAAPSGPFLAVRAAVLGRHFLTHYWGFRFGCRYQVIEREAERLRFGLKFLDKRPAAGGVP